jgi:cytochrome c553
MNSEPNTRKEKPPSLLIKWLIPFVVLLGLLAVFLASRKPPSPHRLSEPAAPGTAAPQPASKQAKSLFIEDLGAPHDTLDGIAATVCRPCHVHQFSDWQQGPHGTATSNSAFTASLKIAIPQSTGPKACLACHAPQDARAEAVSPVGSIIPDTLAADGVSCVACHSRKVTIGNDLLGSSETKVLEALAPRTSDFCARCHNRQESVLTMLDSGLTLSGPAGNPYTEWLASKYSHEGPDFKSCLDCHGKDGTGTSHMWPSDLVSMVRAAYEIRLLPPVRQVNGWRVGYSITNSGAGHMLPTGDPGRMLRIEASVQTPDGAVLAQSVVSFSHLKWRGTSAGPGTEPIIEDDSRLPPRSEADSWITVSDPGSSLAGRSDLVLKYKVTYGLDPASSSILGVPGIDDAPTVIEDTTATVPQLVGPPSPPPPSK